jgi:hypothetical protein
VLCVVCSVTKIKLLNQNLLHQHFQGTEARLFYRSGVWLKLSA